MTMITKERASALIVRKQPEAAIRKWLNQEALGAYAANLVDDPEDHEAAKADNLIVQGDDGLWLDGDLDCVCAILREIAHD